MHRGEENIAHHSLLAEREKNIWRPNLSITGKVNESEGKDSYLASRASL